MEHRESTRQDQNQEDRADASKRNVVKKKNYKELWKRGVKNVIQSMNTSHETFRVGSSKRHLRNLQSKHRNETKARAAKLNRSKLKEIIRKAVKAEMETLENELKQSLVQAVKTE